ncbi:hypothetical protein RBB50_009588 [Rhinocladiella similis]
MATTNSDTSQERPYLKQASTSSSSSNLHANVLNCDSSDQVPLSSYIDGISNPSINDQLSCLDQTFEAGPGEFGDLCMTDGKYANKPSTSRTFLGPISAIASKNEVGTQHGPSAIELLSEISHRDNRVAQRAFRVRQQQALHAATARMHTLQDEVKEAHAMKDHYQRLFENLTVEYEKLLDRLEASFGPTDSFKTLQSLPY